MLCGVDVSTINEPRASVSISPGPRSTASVRDVLSDLTDVDSVVLEQIAVLVGALTSGSGEGGGRSPSPIEFRLWTEAAGVRAELRDRDFALHRADGGLVELDRSMVSAWRLKLVERLADRWSVAHDRELTLCFEFDADRAGDGAPAGVSTAPSREAALSGDGHA
jgi:hypothetical protein